MAKQWKRYLSQGTLVAVMLAAAFYYRFGYVENRLSQLESESLALLLESADYLSDEVRRRQVSVESARSACGDDEDEWETQERLVELKKNIDRLDGLAPVDITKCGASVRAAIDPSGHLHDGEPYRGGARLTFRLTEDRSGTMVYADLDKLLDSVRPPDAWFENVVLADSAGIVLAHAGSSPVVLTRLPRRPGADTDDEMSLPPDDGSFGNTSISRVSISDVEYLLFVQPITFPTRMCLAWQEGEACASQQFILAGAQRRAALVDRAMTVPPTVLFAVIALLTCLILALPMIRVRYLGSREYLNAQDLLVASVAVVMLSAVATFGIFDTIFFEQFKQKQYERLDALSRQMSDQLLEEARDADRLLALLTSRNGLQDPDTARARIEADRVHVIRSAYRTPSLVAWINEDGFQIHKMGLSRKPSQPIPVADRRYFKWAMEALLPPDSSESSEDFQRRLILESIRSKNTGRAFATVSRRIDPMHVANPPGGHAGPAVVAALTAPLRSVIDPVVPPGSQFALIDPDGNVLFHSDERRNLRENLFNKVAGGDRLRAAVWARDPSYRTISQYRDGTYQFVVRPVGETNWSLVAFSDLDRLRAVHAQLLTYALAIFLFFQLIVIAFFGVYVTSKRDRGSSAGLKQFMRGVWPSRDREPYYAQCIGTELSLICAWAAIELTLRPAWRIVGALALAIIAMWAFCRVPFKAAEDEHAAKSKPGAARSESRPHEASTGPHSGSVAPPGLAAFRIGSAASWRRTFRALAARRTPQVAATVVLAACAALVVANRSHLQEAFILPGLGMGIAAVWTHRFGADWVSNGTLWRRRYMQSYFLLVLLLGVLPAFSVYRLMHDEGMVESARKDQLELLHVLEERAERLDAEIREGASTYPGLLRATYFPDSARSAAGRSPAGVFPGEVRVEEIEAFSAPPVPSALGLLFATDHSEALIHGILRKTRRFADAVTPWSYEINSLPDLTESGGLWEWKLAPTPGAIVLQAAAYRPVSTTTSSGYQKLQITSSPPRLRDLLWPPSAFALFLMGVGLTLVFLLWTVIRSTLARIFFLDGSVARSTSSASADNGDYAERLKDEAGHRPDPETKKFLERLERECMHDETLRSIGLKLARNASELDPQREHLVESVLERAESHYRRLWSECSTDERSVLINVAGSGFAGWTCRRVVRDLLRKGLLVLDPGLDVMNESFRRFVHEADVGVEITEWRQAAKAGSWRMLQTPAIVCMVALMAFLLYTQPGAADRTIGVIVALATVVPALGKILPSMLTPSLASPDR